MQESVIFAGAKLIRSVFLASNPWDPISLHQNNSANTDSG